MILTLGPGGAGLTFLNWTIVFLRGDTTYTTINNRSKSVDINPLLGPTAHGFLKDHIQSSNNLYKLKYATKKSVVYVTLTHQNDFEYINAVDCKKVVFDCQDKNKELFSRILTCVPSGEIHQLVDRLSLHFDKNDVIATLLEYNKLFTDYYKIPTSNHDYFVLTYNDIFNELDQRVRELFLFLGEPIDESRFSKWVDIYKDYREKNSSILADITQTLKPVSASTKNQIVKEIIKWKNILSPNK